MKQPDLYYFETIKWRHKPSQILYGEYEPQANFDIWFQNSIDQAVS